MRSAPFSNLLFFHDTATTEIYTLSLHDALPILRIQHPLVHVDVDYLRAAHHLLPCDLERGGEVVRSEEHTSELQSHSDLVCRLLLEKKKRYDRKARTRTRSRRAHAEASGH